MERFFRVSYFISHHLKHVLFKIISFSSAENTWEPVENLDCPELIEEFETKLAESQKRKAEAENASKKKKIAEIQVS